MEFEAERAAEHLDGRLRGGVSAVRDAVDERVDRGGDEDVSLVGDDLGQSGFDRPDDAVQVDVDHTFVGVEVGGGEGRGRVVGDPGVGEYNVYFAEVLLGRVDRLGHLLEAGDIGGVS